MASHRINLRSIALLAAGLLVLGAPDASSQRYLVNPDGTRSRRTTLELTCGAALERFCPDLAATPRQTRNQVICLKPYRTSLSPACRAAVTAALK